MDKTYFDEMKQKIKDFRTKMEQEGKQFFLESAKALFEENPKLLGISWREYTPYFNDGDACEFSANLDSPCILVSPLEEGKDYHDEESWLDDDGWFTKDDKSEEAKIFHNVVKFLTQFDDSDMEILFGDHCRVIVTRESIEVEEYEHD